MKIGRHAVCIVFAVIVAAFTFLRIQTDDEIYMDFNSFSVKASESDVSAGVLSVEADAVTDKEGLFAVSRSVDLPSGSFSFEVDHENGDGARVSIMDGEKACYSQELPAGEGRTSFEFTTDREINDLTVRFFYDGEGRVTIKHLLITTRGGALIYRDNLLMGLLLIILAVFLDIYIVVKKKTKTIPIQAILGAAAVFAASYPLFAQGFLYGHDMAFHMMRIEGVKDALLDGQLPAVIYPNAAYGHGYLGTLYPNIFLYIPAGLRLMGVSALGAWKASFFLINIFSYYTAYLCGKGIAGSQRGAILAAVLYTLAPFRLIDIYFRATLGEAIAMVFFPLVFLGIYNITVGKASSWRVLFVGMWGVINSHILSALFAGVLCAVFFLVFVVKLFKEKRVVSLIYAAAASLAASLMFFVPFFYYRAQDLQLDDTIRRFNPARAAQPMYEIFSSLPRLLTDKDDAYLRREMIPTLGLVGLACIVLSLCAVIHARLQEDEKRFALTALAVEIAIVYVASDMFPWETLEKFEGLFSQLMLLEHPWRLFSIAVCIVAPISALALEKTDWLKPSFVAVSVSLVILSLIAGSLQVDMVFNNRSRAIEIDTGDTAYSYNVDYMPREFENMEELRMDAAPVGEGVSITQYTKKGTHIYLEYEGGESDTHIRLPLLYYRGYRAVNASGQTLTLYEGRLGDVCVVPDAASGAIRVDFAQPVGNVVAVFVSILALIGLLCPEKIKKRFTSLKK